MRYKIEDYLISKGMAELKRYPIGTIVYAYHDEDGFIGEEEVILFPNHTNGPTWEIKVGLPYVVMFGEGNDREEAHEAVKRHLADYEQHLWRMLELRKALQDLENPWEIVE